MRWRPTRKTAHFRAVDGASAARARAGIRRQEHFLHLLAAGHSYLVAGEAAGWGLSRTRQVWREVRAALAERVAEGAPVGQAARELLLSPAAGNAVWAAICARLGEAVDA